MLADVSKLLLLSLVTEVYVQKLVCEKRKWSLSYAYGMSKCV